jgi:uncharacterized phage-associated protein
MAYNVSIIASAFLQKESMTQKKLQKLCYYAQAWNYFYFKKPLMDTKFEAWIHGPVSPQLYDLYKENGYNCIPQNMTLVFLDADAQKIVDAVFKAYGSFDGNQLEGLTHSESPWIKARGNTAPYNPSHNEITLKSMDEFCKENLNTAQPDV